MRLLIGCRLQLALGPAVPLAAVPLVVTEVAEVLGAMKISWAGANLGVPGEGSLVGHGMLESAERLIADAAEFRVVHREILLVGDSLKDVEAGGATSRKSGGDDPEDDGEHHPDEELANR
jgi:hypothetical protein